MEPENRPEPSLVRIAQAERRFDRGGCAEGSSGSHMQGFLLRKLSWEELIRHQNSSRQLTGSLGLGRELQKSLYSPVSWRSRGRSRWSLGKAGSHWLACAAATGASGSALHLTLSVAVYLGCWFSHELWPGSTQSYLMSVWNRRPEAHAHIHSVSPDSKRCHVLLSPNRPAIPHLLVG